jgi:hypothetical protein
MGAFFHALLSTEFMFGGEVLMWELDKRQRILWVAWAVREGCFEAGHELEPMFAGYVADREKLWGNKCLMDSGAWWLPQLATHSLLISKESLAAFHVECQAALSSAEKLSEESSCAVDDVKQALQNIIRVTREAQSRGGWVEIHSRWPPYPGIPQIRL